MLILAVLLAAITVVQIEAKNDSFLKWSKEDCDEKYAKADETICLAVSLPWSYPPVEIPHIMTEV